MAPGAARNSILRLVLRDVAIVLALRPARRNCDRVGRFEVCAENVVRLAPRDISTLAAAAGVLAVVALVAGYFPARRAARSI